MVAADFNRSKESVEEFMARKLEEGLDIEEISALVDQLAEDGWLDQAARPEGAEETAADTYSVAAISEGDREKAYDLMRWHLRKRNAAREAMAEKQAMADLQIAQVKKWLEKETKALTQKVTWHEGNITWAMKTVFEDDDKLSFPEGTVKCSKNRATIWWDEEAALAYALKQPNVDELAPRKLAKQPLKDTLTKAGNAYTVSETGEIVPFVAMIDPEELYSITIE